MNNLSVKCQLDLFDRIVKPVLLCGCEIWGFGNNSILEKVHLKFCKHLLHVKTSTPDFMVYGQLGRYPLDINIKVQTIAYWSKLIAGEDSIKTVNKAYRITFHHLSSLRYCSFHNFSKIFGDIFGELCTLLKADMKSYLPLEMVAIFFLANLFTKQGFSSEYVTVDFICMGKRGLQGAKTENYKIKTLDHSGTRTHDP